MLKIKPDSVYSLWLPRIVDTQLARAWDNPQTAEEEKEDDWFNELWEELAETDQLRLWGLSADLETLCDNEKFADTDWPPISKTELAKLQNEAYQRKEWDTFLELLRRPPRIIPRDRVDYLRGRAWMEMGHPEIALLFFDNAARLDSKNPSYRVLALECVKDSGNFPELLRRCLAYQSDPESPPRLLFRAGDGFHAYAKKTGERQYYQSALDAIDLGFARLHARASESPSLLVAALATKSYCLESLGRPQDSLLVLDDAVKQFPENTALLTIRGLLKLELGIPDAIGDFRQAAGKGSLVAWGYVELAKNEIDQEVYAEALAFCDRGLNVARSDNVAAILLELKAIAMFHLQESKDDVRAIFQRAKEQYPLNDEVQLNSARFETYIDDPQAGTPEWEINLSPRASVREEVYSGLQPTG